jgi:hypothetical protein
MLHFSFYTVKNHNDGVLFALAVSTAALQLGLTAYLLAATASYNTLFVALFCLCAPVKSSCRSFSFLFDALWTILYPSTCVVWHTKGSLDLLANLFGSVFWIFAAAIFWVLPNDFNAIRGF